MHNKWVILVEATIVAMVGTGVAFIANTLSSKGLTLSTNYFPGTNRNASIIASPHQKTSLAITNKERALELLAQRLKKHSISLVDSNVVVNLFKDVRYEQELYVFIDARRDKDFDKGHIPSAYQFDRYYAEKYISTILPVCQTAERIVVYCDGGDCDDSEFTAITLKNAGISETNICVYGGGLKEWSSNGMPVEIGLRKSGNMAKPSK
jgi:rhodanese-related sulfurtransferase